MKLPEYVTIEEVKRICRELSIRDWSALSKPDVLEEEAKAILAELEVGDLKVSLESFKQGLEVELEHGIRFPEANVTNNHPILTGKIVLAHFLESLDYYQRLEVMEIEGDLLKAVVTRNAPKIESLYRKLLNAKRVVSQIESEQIA
jgi:uncharacterized protein DUF5661